MAFDLYATTIKDDRKMVTLNALGSFTFSIHYILLGAYAGAISEAVNAVRTGATLKTKSRYIGLFFAALYGVLLVTQSQNMIDMCPYLCGIILTGGLYFLSGIKLRLCYLIGYTLWLIYSIAAGSVGGTVLFSITLVTISTTIFRLSKDHKRDNNKRLLEP